MEVMVTAPVQPSTGQVDVAKIATLLALVKAQAAVRAQLTQAAVNAALAAFAALSPDDWWDGAKISQAITAALRIVQPSARQAARLTDAYLARSVTLMTGRTHRPGSTVDVTRLRKAIPEQIARQLVDDTVREVRLYLGEHDPDHRHVIAGDDLQKAFTPIVPEPGSPVIARLRRLQAERRAAAAKILDPGEAYGRIAEGYRYAVVAQGATEDTARRKAMVRLAVAAQTDVTLAVREQYRNSLRKIRDIRGYRRILHPELSESGPCGLCVVAADRVYRIEELLPIHGNCKCEVLPIIGSLDPGINLNSDELDAIYDAAGSTGGGKRQGGALKKIRVMLAENGELGPVLADADQHYRGPAMVAKTVVPDRAVRIQAQLEALDKSFAMFKRRQLAGENVDKPLAYHERTIAELQRELATL